MGLYSRYIFPHFLEWIMSQPEFASLRRDLLTEAQGNVFEIGLGTGLNLPFYPEGIDKITTIDINPGVMKKAQQRIANATHEVEALTLNGETIPLEDASFDTVVSTWTLCSIHHVESALRELRRILKPSGSFLFIEHGLSPDPSVRRLQTILTPVQKIIGDGCHFNRDMADLITTAGFQLEKLDRFYMDKAPRFAAYMYKGCARRSRTGP